jgi:hypothetical protein
LKPQTNVWIPEMTPKDDNTVAHITDCIDAACRELPKIADMLAGYPELHDSVASLREVLAILEVQRAKFDATPTPARRATMTSGKSTCHDQNEHGRSR